MTTKEMFFSFVNILFYILLMSVVGKAYLSVTIQEFVAEQGVFSIIYV